MKKTQPWFQNLKQRLFQSVFSGIIFVLTVVGLGALFVYAAILPGFTHIDDDQQLTYDEWQEAVAHLFRKSSSAGEISYTGNVAVSGGVKVGNTTAACSVSNAGMLKYTNNCMSYCNGSDWKEMSCSINGACGSAHGTNRTESPSTTIEKCVAGTVSSVINESGKWTWTCAGLDGGDTMHCSANKIVDGVCGSAHGTVVTGNPSNKCSAGTARNTYQWNSPSIYFTWICGGLNGGSSVDCSTKPA